MLAGGRGTKHGAASARSSSGQSREGGRLIGGDRRGGGWHMMSDMNTEALGEGGWGLLSESR